MNTSDKERSGFQFTEKFNTRAFELLDESQALQFAEGLRIGSSLSSVHAREYARIERKYGKDHPRTQEMALRVEANEVAKKELLIRYTEASTPYADPGKGWAVDGFVRTAEGDPIAGVTVAAYDRHERWYREFGYACTNQKGYFSMAVEMLPDKELHVYMRASKGNKLLPSNKLRLAPAPKSADRVEIIISDAGGKGDCKPPPGRKRKPRPPEQPMGGKEKPATPVKEKPSSGGRAKEAKEKSSKPDTGGGLK